MIKIIIHEKTRVRLLLFFSLIRNAHISAYRTKLTLINDFNRKITHSNLCINFFLTFINYHFMLIFEFKLKAVCEVIFQCFQVFAFFCHFWFSIQSKIRNTNTHDLVHTVDNNFAIVEHFIIVASTLFIASIFSQNGCVLQVILRNLWQSFILFGVLIFGRRKKRPKKIYSFVLHECSI